jgi:5'(3')-deoxyribonucleotidase
MHNRLYVAIDFDDVVADTVPQVLKALNERQLEVFHEWTIDDITRWDMAFCTGFSESTIREEFDRLDYDLVPMVPGAYKLITDLIDFDHRVHIVTANRRTGDIRQWLDNHDLRQVPVTHSTDKLAWCIARGYNVIIDDNPKTLRQCADHGIFTVRYERPWNKELGAWGVQPTEWSVAFLSNAWKVLQNFHTTRSDDQKMWDAYEDMHTMKWNEAPSHIQEKITLDMEDAKIAVDMFVEEKMGYYVIDDIAVNENGAKQTDLKARYDLLPARAVEEVARVLHHGAEKYGVDNWRGLSVSEIHNHTLGHAVNFNRTNELEDLAHTACRALMALEIYLEENDETL